MNLPPRRPRTTGRRNFPAHDFSRRIGKTNVNRVNPGAVHHHGRFDMEVVGQVPDLTLVTEVGRQVVVRPGGQCSRSFPGPGNPYPPVLDGHFPIGHAFTPPCSNSRTAAFKSQS